MKKNVFFLIVFLSGGFLTITAQEKAKEIIGINLNHMDKTVKPSDNFFRYVNGTWLDNTEIPADLADVDSGIIAGPLDWEDLMPEKTIAEDIAIDKAHKRKHLKSVK